MFAFLLEGSIETHEVQSNSITENILGKVYLCSVDLSNMNERARAHILAPSLQAEAKD